MYFYRLAEKIGYQSLINTAKFVGLDHNPTIEVPSLRDKPIVPDPEWKKNRIGVRWTLEDTFNIAIGQGGLPKPTSIGLYGCPYSYQSTTLYSYSSPQRKTSRRQGTDPRNRSNGWTR